MRHQHRADREKSSLLIIDVQERLCPAIYEVDRVIDNCRRLAQGAGILDVPVVATTQYTRGLGPLVPQVAEVLGEVQPLDKTAFSCCADSAIAGRLAGLKRETVVVCGMEAHVCVLQTVLDLLASGYTVHVMADAVSSRTSENRDLALERMRQAGAVISSTEMALFELLGKAGTPEFKAVQALVK